MAFVAVALAISVVLVGVRQHARMSVFSEITCKSPEAIHIFFFFYALNFTEFVMPSAVARHILVETEEVCQDLKLQIEAGKDFAEVAAEFSACPSGKSGGSLGQFSKGQMVPEFDKVVFSEELNKVHGPVETQFGFHLIEITDRSD